MNKLQEIFAYKSEELTARKLVRNLADVKAMAADADAPRGFHRALVSSPHPVALIAEVKKSSPSEGLIRADCDAVEVARAYESAGADCLSVLTDEKYFDGSEENLCRCREAATLPILRKDFTSDPYHIYEARAMGADAVLLIVACLSPVELREYRELAEALGMDVLVEVHTESEADIAITSGAKLIGVNNRNLATFKVSMDATRRIVPLVPKGITTVSESGLNSRGDVYSVQKSGSRAVLIGTAFCASRDVAAKVRSVMGWK